MRPSGPAWRWIAGSLLIAVVYPRNSLKRLRFEVIFRDAAVPIPHVFPRYAVSRNRRAGQ
jgi:hypothetical protein